MIRGAVRLVRRVLLTLLLLPLLLCGAEVAVRVYEVQTRRPLSPSRANVVWDKLTTPSWTVRQELRPLTNLSLKSSEGGPSHEVRVNSFGLRGAELEVPKPPETVRVLCLGDEKLLGAPIAEEQHFCHFLQSQLQSRTKWELEVCNAGIPGASPVTEYLLLTHRLAALQPDLVILTVSESDLMDDFRDRRYTRYSPAGVPLACRHPSLSRKTRTDLLTTWRQEFRLLDLGLQWAGHSWKQQADQEDWLTTESCPEDLKHLRTDRKAIDHALQPIIPLTSWCQKNYSTLCIFYVPSDEVSSSETAPSENLFAEVLRELAAAQQIVLVEAARTTSAENSRRRCTWTLEEHQQFALQLGERVITEISGPWNSPYFQSGESMIAPVSHRNHDQQQRFPVRHP